MSSIFGKFAGIDETGVKDFDIIYKKKPLDNAVY